MVRDKSSMSTLCAKRLPPAAPTEMNNTFCFMLQAAIAVLARTWSQASITASTGALNNAELLHDALDRDDALAPSFVGRPDDDRVEAHRALLESTVDGSDPNAIVVVVEPALRARSRHLQRVRDALIGVTSRSSKAAATRVPS